MLNFIIVLNYKCNSSKQAVWIFSFSVDDKKSMQIDGVPVNFQICIELDVPVRLACTIFVP